MGVVGSVEDVGTGDDIGDAVVIEVGYRRGPGVVEGVQGLALEVGRGVLERAVTVADVFIGDVLELNVSFATDIERDRAVAGGGFGDTAALAPVVLVAAKDVRVEDEFQVIPLRWVKIRVGLGVGILHAWRLAVGAVRVGRARRGPPGLLGRRRRRDAHLAASVAQRRALGDLPSRVGGDVVILHELALTERSVGALHPAIGRLLDAEEDAGLAAGCAEELREELDVLVRVIHDQPAAGAGRSWSSAQLAVGQLPLRLPKRMPAGEARTLEHRIRCERRAGQELLALAEGWNQTQESKRSSQKLMAT